jgi:hypothetical protein
VAQPHDPFITFAPKHEHRRPSLHEQPPPPPLSPPPPLLPEEADYPEAGFSLATLVKGSPSKKQQLPQWQRKRQDYLLPHSSAHELPQLNVSRCALPAGERPKRPSCSIAVLMTGGCDIPQPAAACSQHAAVQHACMIRPLNASVFVVMDEAGMLAALDRLVPLIPHIRAIAVVRSARKGPVDTPAGTPSPNKTNPFPQLPLDHPLRPKVVSRRPHAWREGLPLQGVPQWAKYKLAWALMRGSEKKRGEDFDVVVKTRPGE